MIANSNVSIRIRFGREKMLTIIAENQRLVKLSHSSTRFHLWKRKMRMLQLKKDFLSVMGGKETEPTTTPGKDVGLSTKKTSALCLAGSKSKYKGKLLSVGSRDRVHQRVIRTQKRKRR